MFQFSTEGPERISNNVFYDVFSTIGGDGSWEAVNNVFVAPPDDSSIVWGSIPAPVDSTDIRGKPLVGKPDIGAYEHP